MKHSYIVMKVDLGQHKKGDQILITVDEDGIPLDHYWRKRLKEAEKDGSCEIVHDKKDLPPRSVDNRKAKGKPATVEVPPKRSVPKTKRSSKKTPKPKANEE